MFNLKPALRAGVPIVIIETSDPAQSMRAALEQLNGKANTSPLLEYALLKGLSAINDPGADFINSAFRDVDVRTMSIADVLGGLNQPSEFERLRSADTPAYIFLHNPQLMWDTSEEAGRFVAQGLWSLRDVLKPSGSMLIGLAPLGVKLPNLLTNDAVIIKDTLPNREEIAAIVARILKAAKLSLPDNAERIYDALTGLSAFAAEQVLSMSLTTKGVNLERLWERKVQMIEQTPGLSVWREGVRFGNIGGCDFIKGFIRSLFGGRRRPQGVVFIDEIEKAMAGAGGDNTGVTQDQLRCLLTYMQDNKARGMILIGPAGSGKSEIAKAAGNEFGVPTIAFDMGEMKSPTVGSSEARIRAALEVVSSVTGGEMFFIATCNSIGVIPAELRRRFNRGIYIFDLPDADVRRQIWDVYMQKCPSLSSYDLPNDEGWTGAEIAYCADMADDMGITLQQAAAYVVPVSVSARETVEGLLNSSSGRYIDANKGGVYARNKLTANTVAADRRIAIEED